MNAYVHAVKILPSIRRTGMSNQPEKKGIQASWLILVFAVFTLIIVSWIIGYEGPGIGIAGVLIALWDARG